MNGLPPKPTPIAYIVAHGLAQKTGKESIAAAGKYLGEFNFTRIGELFGDIESKCGGTESPSNLRTEAQTNAFIELAKLVPESYDQIENYGFSFNRQLTLNDGTKLIERLENHLPYIFAQDVNGRTAKIKQSMQLETVIDRLNKVKEAAEIMKALATADTPDALATAKEAEALVAAKEDRLKEQLALEKLVERNIVELKFIPKKRTEIIKGTFPGVAEAVK